MRLLIRGYQLLVSPAIHLFAGPGMGCRFTPSCSQYAEEAVRIHGAFRGGWLAVRRLGRCNPLCAGGHDPVPLSFERVISPQSTSRTAST